MNASSAVFHSWTVKGTPFWTPKHYESLESKPIGSGAYATVAAALNKRSGEKLALKRITNVFQHDPTAAKRTLREILLLRALDHPNIIAISDMWQHKDDIYIAEPLMEADLHRIVRSSQALSDEHFQFFVWQILKGLKYMHSANVIHRDLKPGNILVNANCDLKICDFGLARAMECEEENLEKTTYVVTRWYRAPELMIADDYTETVDIWAVGCILAEMLGRKSLFPGKNTLHQLELVFATRGTPTEEELTSFRAPDPKALTQVRKMCKTVKPRKPLAKIFPDASPMARDLVDAMLDYDPAKRPTAAKALEHPWLAAQHDPASETVAAGTIDFDFERRKVLTTEDVRKLIIEECNKMNGGGGGEREFEPERVSLPPVAQPLTRKKSEEPMPPPNPALVDGGDRPPGSPKSGIKIAEQDKYKQYEVKQEQTSEATTTENMTPEDFDPMDKPKNNSCFHPCLLM